MEISPTSISSVGEPVSSPCLSHKYLNPNLTALNAPQPSRGSTARAVEVKPSKIPCSKNPTACPGLCPVGFSCFKAISMSFEGAGKVAGGVMNCGRGVENISDVNRGWRVCK